MLDRLLAAWKQAGDGRSGQAPPEPVCEAAQTVGLGTVLPELAMLAEAMHTPAEEAQLSDLSTSKDGQEPDAQAGFPADADGVQDAFATLRRLEYGLPQVGTGARQDGSMEGMSTEMSASAPAADPVLANFWDTWQEAARQVGSNAEDAQGPQAAPLDICSHDLSRHQSGPRRHMPRHVQRRRAEAINLREEQKLPQQHRRRRSRAQGRAHRHPATAAAASGQSDDAKADPLDRLLQMHPVLDPVVADFVLQANPSRPPPSADRALSNCLIALSNCGQLCPAGVGSHP